MDNNPLYDAVSRRLTDLKLDYRQPEVVRLVQELMFRELVIVWDTDSAVTSSLCFATLRFNNPLTFWTRATGFQNTEAETNV